jgi:hypothetical protein
MFTRWNTKLIPSHVCPWNWNDRPPYCNLPYSTRGNYPPDAIWECECSALWQRNEEGNFRILNKEGLIQRHKILFPTEVAHYALRGLVQEIDTLGATA